MSHKFLANVPHALHRVIISQPVQAQRQIRHHRLGELRLGALGEQVGVRLADFVGEGDERQFLPRVEHVAPARETIALDTEAERFQWRQRFIRHGVHAPILGEAMPRPYKGGLGGAVGFQVALGGQAVGLARALGVVEHDGHQALT